VVAVLLAGLVPDGSAALAQPPPGDPGDEALARSRAQVSARAAEVGRLTGRLSDLDNRADDLQVALAGRREDAEAALETLAAAEAAAAEAAKKADEARVATEAAGTAVDDARARLDVFVTATYQESLDIGPFGLLTAAQDPGELVARAEFTEMVAHSQLAAQESLERARVARVNAESTARAARNEADEQAAAAAAAKQASDAALGRARAAAQENARALEQVARERADVQARLDAAEAQDAGLRAARERFRAWQQQENGRLSRPPVFDGSVGGGVKQVIDRALSQVGVQYVWGGGNGRGPSTGIPDAFGSPLDRVGFDCSGLMLYAYNGVGVKLPRVSRSQFNAGRKVPISDLRPGDLVFFRNGGAPIHHVAMYIGEDRMVEAPYTGANVRVVPLRRRGIVPEATRFL
jgi:cell wall-associated NlpC family hydrolase